MISEKLNSPIPLIRAKLLSFFLGLSVWINLLTSLAVIVSHGLVMTP